MKTNILYSHYFWFFVVLSIVVGFVGWRSQNPAPKKVFDGYVYKKAEGTLFISTPHLAKGQGEISGPKGTIYDRIIQGDSICFTKEYTGLKIAKLGKCHENKH